MSCSRSNMFGKPGEGIHSYRIYDIAIIDVLFTVIGAYLIHLLIPKYPFSWILLILFGLGIMLHRFFCVRTTVDKFLFS